MENSFYGLRLPHEGHGLVDVRVDAVVDGAAEGGGFEELALGVIRRERDLNGDGQAHNAARAVLAHVLFDADLHAGEIELLLLRLDADDRGHAGGERGGDEVGRGEGLAFAAVIDGGIGDEGVLRGAVGGLAAEIAGVIDSDGDGHGR